MSHRVLRSSSLRMMKRAAENPKNDAAITLEAVASISTSRSRADELRRPRDPSAPPQLPQRLDDDNEDSRDERDDAGEEPRAELLAAARSVGSGTA